MALIECGFFSETLKLSTSMNVILPQKTKAQIGMEGKSGSGNPPLLYLLHGISDDHSSWCRRTSIERYASAYGLAVVMPAAARSFYTNMISGYAYWDFFHNELPEIVHSFFKVSRDPAKTFVAGLSMGGFGAFKLALHNPERYAAAASLSGALHLAKLDEIPSVKNRIQNDFKLTFGSLAMVPDSDNDLFCQVQKRLAEEKKLPFLYQACGTKDMLYEHNLVFKQYLEKMNIDFHYHEEETAHEWIFWDAQIQAFLALLSQKGLL